MDIESDAETSHSDLTKEEWSQVYIEEAKEMAGNWLCQRTSPAPPIPCQVSKELLESDRETFSYPLFLDRVDDFLQDHDTSVLSTALSLCYDLKEDDDNESACLQRIGTYLVDIFLQAQDERIRNQAFNVLRKSQKCDGLSEGDLGKLFVAFVLDDCKVYHKNLIAIFKDSLWKRVKDAVQDNVGQDSITQVIAVIIIAVISTRNMIESMMTTYGAGLSEATGINLLESTAASLVKRLQHYDVVYHKDQQPHT
ncbi:MAG: hypothetical protein J3R72DRAFT_418836 [Linnemannia gamsii]|nr:MAG: hypothetical protein J3R72DRAFT_418836 [Linnemannia gamsii]